MYCSRSSEDMISINIESSHTVCPSVAIMDNGGYEVQPEFAGPSGRKNEVSMMILIPAIHRAFPSVPLVAAGAVVTKDVLPHTVVAGVPAKPIKKIDGTQMGMKKLTIY